MKRSILFFSFLFFTNAHAAVVDAGKYQHPSESEIQQNRMCFQDLEVLGCGKQDDDQGQFRSCLSNVVDKLDDQCKKMMLDLYGE